MVTASAILNTFPAGGQKHALLIFAMVKDMIFLQVESIPSNTTRQRNTLLVQTFYLRAILTHQELQKIQWNLEPLRKWDTLGFRIRAYLSHKLQSNRTARMNYNLSHKLSSNRTSRMNYNPSLKNSTGGALAQG